MNWEYKVTHPGNSLEPWSLNRLGEKGWELVTITDAGSYIFKRPLHPPLVHDLGPLAVEEVDSPTGP